MPFWNEELQQWGYHFYEEVSSFEWLGIRRNMPSPTKQELQNRYSYHAPHGSQQQRYELIRAKCLELAEVIAENTPFSREQSSAFSDLDMVMMRANAAIARNEQ